jgi:hypothetical protein
MSWILKTINITMKLAENMFLKMIEDEAKKKAKEEDKGKKLIDYNDDLVELLVSKVMKKFISILRSHQVSVRTMNSIRLHLITLDLLC